MRLQAYGSGFRRESKLHAHFSCEQYLVVFLYTWFPYVATRYFIRFPSTPPRTVSVRTHGLTRAGDWSEQPVTRHDTSTDVPNSETDHAN